jgi:hypothetical protein
MFAFCGSCVCADDGKLNIFSFPNVSHSIVAAKPSALVSSAENLTEIASDKKLNGGFFLLVGVGGGTISCHRLRLLQYQICTTYCNIDI